MTQVSNATAVAASALSACAIVQGGAVKCWGYDGLGQLGNGVVQDSVMAPVDVVGLAGATSLAGGAAFMCAGLSDGGASCWGDNFYGELGTGSTSPQQNPTAANVPSMTGVTAIAAGGDAACALVSGGRVECWGSGYTPTPAPIAGLSGVTQVAVGSGFACALLGNGDVECWGDNSVGELGNGTTSVNPLPTPAPVGW